MSLSSFLLGKDAAKAKKGKSIDTGLDELFRSTAVAPTIAAPPVRPPTAFISTKERKRKEAPVDVSPPSSTSIKRSKADQNSTSTHSKGKKAKPTTPKKPKHKAKAAPSSSGSDSEKNETAEVLREEEDASGEGATAGPSSSSPPSEASENSDEEEVDLSKLVHESLLNSGKSKSGAKKVKHVPSEETPEKRDARTIFVGNVSVEVVTSRPLQKQLKRHILQFVPTARIESVRFRSVAFSKPTAQSTDATSSKDGRQHNRDRAASWRESHAGNDEEASADKGKTFLTQKEKKRIFFIKQELHSGVDSVNAYIVFAHPPPPVEGRPSSVMDPYEAAKIAIKGADGSLFNGHSIRVDTAVKSKGKGKLGEQGNVEEVADPKATIFVGNLDFACKEEDVRAFFEKLIVEEKGAPEESRADEAESDEDDDEGGDAKPASRSAWVKRVRIIRDKDTLLGKGFGYVQFTDRSCVDEILAMEEVRLKFAKRKLRVQRCKTLPGASKPVKPSPSNPTTAKPGQFDRSRPATPIVVPRGDPTLGSKLASLSKEERKKVKSTDADRVARRLAKKQAKALADKGVKSRGDTAKDRDRVRKRPVKERVGAPEKKKAKVGRVRSGKALSKMNTKK